MSSNVIDGKAIHDACERHDADRDKFHEALLKLNPDDKRCGVCGYPLKKVRMTYKTTLTITISSRMTRSVTIDTENGDKAYTKTFQKQLHRGIAQTIVSTIENARDDLDFDTSALEHVDVDICGFTDDPEISDFADVRLVYHHGKKKWIGDVVMTKAERNEV